MKRIYDYSSESAKLNEGSYFIHGNYRIAVIMPELIRIEIANADGEFTDLPTQGVWKRNFTPVWFEKQIEKDFIRVDTHKISLKIDLNNIKKSTVTFKNARKPKEAAAAVPLERLLIETDAPYLAPHPKRGTLNHSGNLEYTNRSLAEIKGISEEKMAEITEANARRIFKI